MGKNRIYPQGPRRPRSLQAELTAVRGLRRIYWERRMQTAAEPHTRPCSLHWFEIRTGAPTMSNDLQCWEGCCPGFHFPLEDQSLRGGQSRCWGRYNAANLYSPLLPSHALCLGLWGAGGCLNLTLVFWDVLLLNRCNLFLEGGELGQDQPVSASWRRHPSLHAFLLPQPQASFTGL